MFMNAYQKNLPVGSNGRPVGSIAICYFVIFVVHFHLINYIYKSDKGEAASSYV